MKLLCAPDTYAFPAKDGALHVVLYGQRHRPQQGSAGKAARDEVLRLGLIASPRAWDFLSLALSVVTADFAGQRDQSPDGWTREFEIEIAVADPAFWATQAETIEGALAFLTTDRWHIRFVEGGIVPQPRQEAARPDENCVVLLSGGLDSLVGAIDLAAAGMKPFAVSQVITGDAAKQADFARKLAGGLRHLQLNHNALVPGHAEHSQRARSLIFLAFGVLAATTTARHSNGAAVTLYVCENGFIAVNPPLTGARIGSLSTRTAHPLFLSRVQRILDAAGLHVRIENPYRLTTKGEMLAACANQDFLRAEATNSTSCGRFQRFTYRHCGRCIPCQIRRAAFLRWGVRDRTGYVYKTLGKRDRDHAAFDDVRAAAMAIAEVGADGLDAWLGTALSFSDLGDIVPLKDMVKRGLDELRALHLVYGIK